MHDWNTVITVHEGGFDQAFETLAKLGELDRTEFFNVLVMKVEDIPSALENLQRQMAADPARYKFLARFVPLTRLFNFTTPHEFEDRAKEAVFTWRPEVAGGSFHVRMHRRGFKGKLSSMQEEQFLDRSVLEAMRDAGSEARVEFDDPDYIIALESVGQRAGLSFWTREERRKYPFLKLDSKETSTLREETMEEA